MTLPEHWTPPVVVVALLVLLLLIVVAMLFAWMLTSAGAAPAPAMLVVSLSLLTFAALLGGLWFNSDSALALAGAGLGSLAGAVSSTFQGQQGGCPPEPEDESFEEHSE